MFGWHIRPWRTTRLLRERRVRRGAEIVEFVLVFPLFLVMFFAVMEFSWYFYQRSAVVEAARRGCQQAGQMDPDTDPYVQTATAVALDSLAGVAGIDCGVAEYGCGVTILDLSASDPPRLTCAVGVNFRSLTGFLGTNTDPGGPADDLIGSRSGVRLLPSRIRGRSVSIFEEAD